MYSTEAQRRQIALKFSDAPKAPFASITEAYLLRIARHNHCVRGIVLAAVAQRRTSTAERTRVLQQAAESLTEATQTEDALSAWLGMLVN